jgi:hypothetical protein
MDSMDASPNQCFFAMLVSAWLEKASLGIKVDAIRALPKCLGLGGNSRDQGSSMGLIHGSDPWI